MSTKKMKKKPKINDFCCHFADLNMSMQVLFRFNKEGGVELINFYPRGEPFKKIWEERKPQIIEKIFGGANNEPQPPPQPQQDDYEDPFVESPPDPSSEPSPEAEVYYEYDQDGRRMAILRHVTRPPTPRTPPNRPPSLRPPPRIDIPSSDGLNRREERLRLRDLDALREQVEHRDQVFHDAIRQSQGELESRVSQRILNVSASRAVENVRLREPSQSITFTLHEPSQIVVHPSGDADSNQYFSTYDTDLSWTSDTHDTSGGS